jgi:uncharacterized membrane protein
MAATARPQANGINARGLFSGANAINAGGQIVGSSDTFLGARAVLWTRKIVRGPSPTEQLLGPSA